MDRLDKETLDKMRNNPQLRDFYTECVKSFASSMLNNEELIRLFCKETKREGNVFSKSFYKECIIRDSFSLADGIVKVLQDKLNI